MDIQSTRGTDTSATIYLTGDLDLAAEDAVAATIDGLLTDSPPQIVIDLTDVAFCDSSGIRILLKALYAGQAVGTQIHISNTRPRVAAVLWLTGVWPLLTDEPLPDDARQHLPGTQTRGDLQV